MEGNLIHRIYDFVNHFINLNDSTHNYPIPNSPVINRICPITGLDISMQPKNSRFLSYTGVKWYFENDRVTYKKILEPRLTKACKKKDPNCQFRSIAHSIRNQDSNPRNNSRRAIRKLLEETDCLFDNKKLIDTNILNKADLAHSN